MDILTLTYAGHRLTIVQTDEGHALDVDGDRLGPVIGDCAQFFLDDQVIFAGVELEGAHHVALDGVGVARVTNGVWMTFPVPFTPGMRVSVAWRDQERSALRTYRTPPLERRDLEPHPGAAWTGYAPA